MVAVEWFSTIAAESLSGVAFLYDYVQLHFNLDPLLNIYTPVTVVVDGASHVSGDIGFANALIGQIDKPVSHVSVEAGYLHRHPFPGHVGDRLLDRARQTGARGLHALHRERRLRGVAPTRTPAR